MFLSSHEIARSREHALNNLLDFSAACIEAGQRLAELVSANGRDAVHHGSRHFAQVSHGQLETLTQFPATVWLENSARASRLIDSTLEIMGEANKAMIRNAESHVRVIDEMIFAVLNRATRTSPWEAELALHAMKNSLESAEQGLHGISEAAIKTVTLAEKEMHEATGILAAGTPAQGRRATPAKKPAAT